MTARVLGLALLALLGCLAGCKGSVTPRTYAVCMYSHCFDPDKDPYWENPVFEKSLLAAVQSTVHNPVDAADTTSHGLHATVKFTYLQGNIQYPELSQGTGDAAMDRMLILQVASAQVPQATGLRADEPHQFVMDLDMPTPYESFEYSVFDAIDAAKIYPKEAILTGAQGITAMGFDYADGKATDISMAKSSSNRALDKASLTAVTKAVMPPAPAIYAGKTFHLEAFFCYELNQSDKDKSRCPTGRNVILVTGTRIKRTEIMQGMPTKGD
jgi:hypothetical protein